MELATTDSNPRVKLLSRFIRERIFANHQAGKCVAVNLYHEAEGAKNPQLLFSRSIDLPDGEDMGKVDAYIDDIVRDLLVYAQTDTDESGSHVQRYVVKALYGEGKVIHGRQVFRCQPQQEPGEDEDAALDTEPRNARGLVSQAMRHSEALMRLHVNGNDAVVRSLVMQNERLANAFVSSLDKMGEFLSRLTDAEDRRAERMRTLAMEERKAKNDEMVFRQLASTIPVIANRMAGGNIVPTKLSTRDQLMVRLFEGMDESRFARFLDTLTEEQKIAVAELYDSLNREVKRQKGEDEGEGKTE